MYVRSYIHVYQQGWAAEKENPLMFACVRVSDTRHVLDTAEGRQCTYM